MTDTATRLSRALEGRYRIVREVGSGGMATVYLAEDLRHHREVALKVLRPELAATMGPDRFFREIQVAARLQHPHILPLHDSGEADGFLYFVMPFVAGESLRTRLDRIGELPIADAVRILTQVADALSYSHSQGVVHRDIKPDNVMLSGRHALVTDFGVAKAVREAAGESKVTTAGVALGTPAYMAPEQAVADPQLDHRVDIYALGVLAYELLTGRTPFHGLAPQQMLMAHVTDAPEPLRKWRDACPAELEAIVMRCLAKRAADRYQSADEVLHLLEPLAGSSGGITPTQSRPASAGGSGAATPNAKSLPPVARAGAFVAILASLLAVLVSTSADRDDGSTFARVQLTASGNAFAPALSPDGTRIAYAERVCDVDEQCTFDLKLQDVGGAGATSLVRGLLALGGIDWTSDGRWLVYHASGADRYGAYAVLALGGEPRYLGCCGLTLGRGDTIRLATSAGLDGDGQVLRRITIGDGRVLDSVVLAGWNGVVQAAWDIPGTEFTLAATVRGSESGDLRLFDRDGVVRDSLELEAPTFYQHQVRTGARSFSLAIAARRDDPVEYRRFDVDAKGRIDREYRVVARDVRAIGGSQLAPDGRIAIADGTRDFAVHALEISAASARPTAQRVVDRSTAGITASITPDGSRVILFRTRPNEPRTREVAIRPFAGGTETRLGVLRDLDDWDPSQDGRSLLTVQRLGRDRLQIGHLDLATGQVRAETTLVGPRSTFETVTGGGYVNVLGLAAIELHGLAARRDTVISLPDRLASILYLEPSPDGRAIAISAWGATSDSIEFFRADLPSGTVRHLASIYGEGTGGITWMPDGTLRVPVLESVWNDTWYELSSEGGVPKRLPLRLMSDASFRFSRDGKRGVARENSARSDVFLLTPTSKK